MMWLLLTGPIDLEFSGDHSSNIVWSSELETVQVKCFEQHVGPQVPIPFSSVGAFFLFFTRTLLEYIVMQSNKYAFECMGAEKYESWEITVDELSAFIGFMLSLNKHGFELGECWQSHTFKRDNLMLEQLWGNVTSMEPLFYTRVIPLM